MSHHTSTVGPAPEIVAPSAPSPFAAWTSSHDFGYRCARRGWWSRSPRPRATSPRSPRARPSTSIEACAMLNTASAIGIREGSASRAFCVRTAVAGTTSRHSRPGGGSKRSAWPSTHSTKPPRIAAATLSGWPSIFVASPSTSAPSSKIESAATRPATIAAALVPSPPESGMSDRIVNSKSSGEARAANPRTIRLRLSRAIRRSVWTANCPVSTTSTSRCRSSAAPITSNPGPRLAEDAGTRTVLPSIHPGRPSRPPPSPARTARRRPPGRARSAGPSGRCP